MSAKITLVPLFLFAWIISTKANLPPNRIGLPSGRVGHLKSFTPDHATFTTTKGQEVWEWMDLDFPSTLHVQNTDRLQFEQRVVTDKNTKFTRTLLSIRINENQWRSYLIDRENNHPSQKNPSLYFPTGRRTALTSYTTPARFLDNQTIVVVPDYHLIACRDYNHDGTNETFKAYRTMTSSGGRLRLETTTPPTWTCNFSAWNESYIFIDYKETILPQIPKPHSKPGFIYWGDAEYLLEDLIIENPYGFTNSPVNFIRYPLNTPPDATI